VQPRAWKRLLDSGVLREFNVATVNLEPIFGDIDAYAEVVHGAVERLRAATGAARVVLVGHSMGGLASRVYLRRHGDAHVARVVTLASPHHGTVFGRLGHSRNARQMGRGSRFIAQVAADDRGRWARFTTVATRDDNLVVPRSSPLLPGSRQIEIDGVGHLALIEDPRAWQVIADEARRAFPAAPRPAAP
jgi:pimeloyl-ACP methyl ester carboxylesterase